MKKLSKKFLTTILLTLIFFTKTDNIQKCFGEIFFPEPISTITEMVENIFIENLKNTDYELKHSRVVYSNKSDSEEKRQEAKKNNKIFQSYEKARENSEIALKRNEIPNQQYYIYTVKKEDITGGNSFNKLAASLDQRQGTLATANGISFIDDIREGTTLILPIVQGIFVAENPSTDFEFLIKQEMNKEIEKQKEEDKKTKKSTVKRVKIENKNYYFIPGKNLSQTTKAFAQKKDEKMVLPLSRKRITSPFGYRTSPISGTWKLHAGIDLGAPIGTDVFACKSGSITESSFNSIYGNFIIIKHSDKKTSTYAHLSQSFVKKGQSVKTGEKIGKVGMTGATTGPHLHFEIRENGNPTDPFKFVK